MKKLKFSIPLYPDLSKKYIENSLIPFIIKYREYITDIYVTLRMFPFQSDAMGTIFKQEDIVSSIANALIIQEKTGVQISPVFNNINISPNEKNLDSFIENFEMLYSAGIRSCTIPFTSWLYFGKIQKNFPELYIKNTVLHAIDKPREVYEAFMAGFDYINLDRNLLRSQDQLKEIYKARDKAQIELNKELKLSILWNENCIGNCPIQSEHYTYNFNNNIKTQPKVFFKSSMHQVSCYKWEKENPAYGLKKASIIPTKEFMEGLKGIDVFKMHGRESKNVFLNTLYIIEHYVNDGLEFLQNTNEFFEFKKKYNIPDKDFYNLINDFKNCNFDCWKCSKCEDIIK